ncbi:MAG TPA: M23 family metallopeptidase [Dehalococcoidia bacterium]|nr:M23 family metallopeptidase [Dehalococcoidia bacterium]
MPDTKHNGTLNFLQRFGVHIILVAAGAAAYFLAVVADSDEEAPSESVAAPIAAAERPAPQGVPEAASESPAGLDANGNQGYVRSPLVPQTPITEQQEPPPAGPQTDREELGDRTPSAVEELTPLFVEYRVQEGDTVSQVAANFGVTEQTILENNQEIDDPAALEIGEHLIIPTVDGVLHTVQLGQSLDQIATLFQTDVEQIVNFQGNGLRSAEDITENRVILVVGGTFPEPVDFQAIPGDGFPLVVPETGFLAGFPPAVNETSGFILPYWPCSSPSAIQDFGYARGRLHAGVDMPSFCARSSNVYAAQTGTVITAGWSGGYGNLVVIDHGLGFSSYYAHLSQIHVTLGQYVYRGTVIGVSGNTGASFGEHLHFEIRINGQPTDPKPYLPWPFPY